MPIVAPGNAIVNCLATAFHVKHPWTALGVPDVSSRGRAASLTIGGDGGPRGSEKIIENGAGGGFGVHVPRNGKTWLTNFHNVLDSCRGRLPCSARLMPPGSEIKGQAADNSGADDVSRGAPDVQPLTGRASPMTSAYNVWHFPPPEQHSRELGARAPCVGRLSYAIMQLFAKSHASGPLGHARAFHASPVSCMHYP